MSNPFILLVTQLVDAVYYKFSKITFLKLA